MSARIVVVTGTRAEYGLLRPLMRLLDAAPAFDLSIVATGMHLSPEFGLTYREIESDGFEITEKVEMLVSGDSGGAVARSTGMGTIGLAGAYERLCPEAVVLLGDRFETLAAATAANLMRIPIAHIHGGEVTEGAVDDAIRHAITKLSLLHFASTELYRERIIQLGEEPDRVFAVGAPGLDNVLSLDPAPLAEIEAAAGIRIAGPLALVTYNPVTLAAADDGLESLLDALGARPELTVLITMPNADAQWRSIAERLKRFVADNPSRAAAVTSLGWRLYLSAMRRAAVVAGNSSSGIIEAPSFGVPTLDIGDRQRGRVRADSVVHAETDLASVASALDKALSPEFREMAAKVANPYGDGHASERIAQLLADNLDRLKNPAKRFYDLGPRMSGGDAT